MANTTSRPALGPSSVTIIVPTRNRPEMLRHALESISAQTFRDVEVIVINDAGADVEPVISRSGVKDRTVYFRHAENFGPAAARNTGLRHARGTYIAYLDDDDVFLPDHVGTLVSSLDSTEFRVAYSDACRATNGTLTGDPPTIRIDDVPFSSDWDGTRILAENFVPTPCVMHARSCLAQTGNFDETLGVHEDWECWIRLSQVYPFRHVKRVTCAYRTHRDGRSLTGEKRSAFLVSAHRIYARYAALSAKQPGAVAKQLELLSGLELELYGQAFGRLERTLYRRRALRQVPGIKGASPGFTWKKPLIVRVLDRLTALGAR